MRISASQAESIFDYVLLAVLLVGIAGFGYYFFGNSSLNTPLQTASVSNISVIKNAEPLAILNVPEHVAAAGNLAAYAAGSLSGEGATTPQARQGIACADVPSAPLRLGDEGRQVIKLQELLNADLGISLMVTGNYDVVTAQAVQLFQARYGIEPTDEAERSGAWGEMTAHQAAVICSA